MSLLLSNSEQWLDTYEAASARQQYEMMMAAIAQPIPEDVIESLDLVMELLELQDELLKNNQIESTLGLIDTLQQQQLTLYQKEFPYFDNFLAEYYLYLNEPQLIQPVVERYKTDPVAGIDYLFQLLDYLKFYGMTELATDLCRTTYDRVRMSPKVMGGAEVDLASVILISLVEQVHQTLQRGETVDWEAFSTEIGSYGFTQNQDLIADIRYGLETEIEIDQQFLKNFKQERQHPLLSLSFAFSKEMAERKGMSFICSQAIWKALLDFLERRKAPHKQVSQPDGYFALDQKKLDAFVANLIGGFLSMKQAVGFGLIWGIPYVYEFLHSKQVIRQELQQQAIAAATAIKALLIQGFQSSLWKYDFVHRWLPPDSVSEADFAAEAEQFAASLLQVTPLSEEPGQGTFESKMHQLAKAMGLSEPLNKDKAIAEKDPIALPPPVKSIAPAWEPPKPRKSPLKQAADLASEQSKPKKPGKKKPQKGF
ncbi:MAG: hypothetical protein WCA35_01105 [Kovacikia sp.]